MRTSLIIFIFPKYYGYSRLSGVTPGFNVVFRYIIFNKTKIFAAPYILPPVKGEPVFDFPHQLAGPFFSEFIK